VSAAAASAPAPLTLRALQVRAVHAPLKRPLQTSGGTVRVAPLALIDLLTEQGVTGRAYLFCYTPLALKPVVQLLQNLSEFLRGDVVAGDVPGIVDGDAVLLICGMQLKAEGRLRGDTVVATVMSNIGLELALRAQNIALLRCQVGDRYVKDEMVRHGYTLGGEQSGHVIFSDYLFTGDGLGTALQMVRVMLTTGRTLSDLAAQLTTYPQILVNVRVRERVDLKSVPALEAVIRTVEGRLAGQGRLLVRYSGTEPLLRIMLEGQRESEIRTWAEEIAAAVKTHLA